MTIESYPELINNQDRTIIGMADITRVKN